MWLRECQDHQFLQINWLNVAIREDSLWHSSFHSSSLEGQFSKTLTERGILSLWITFLYRTLPTLIPTPANRQRASHPVMAVASAFYIMQGPTKGKQLHIISVCEHPSIINCSPSPHQQWTSTETWPQICQWFRQGMGELHMCPKLRAAETQQMHITRCQAAEVLKAETYGHSLTSIYAKAGEAWGQ